MNWWAEAVAGSSVPDCTRGTFYSTPQLTITCEVTANDLKTIGDRYWSLKVTNFDRKNASQCTLKVQYEDKKK
jgi:hypothetical protein